MRREGRQHGLVITYGLLPPPVKPKARLLNRLDGPPTAGVYTKVSTKPTNHSKFTGRCGRTMCASCRLRPAGKSKDKTKGSHKLKPSGDELLWFDGVPATRVLGHLHGDVEHACDDDGLDQEEHGVSIEEESQLQLVNDDEMGLDGDWILVEKCEV